MKKILSRTSVHLFIAAVFLVVMMIVRFSNFALYRQLVAEDNLLELSQGLWYLFGSLVVITKISYFTSLKRIQQFFTQRKIELELIYVFIFGVLLVFGLEEISWGQRIFNLRNPAYFAINNVQHEISFHNLSYVQQYLHLGYIILGISLALIFPMLKNLNFFKKYKNCMPGWKTSSYFLPISIVYLLLMFAEPISLTGPNSFGMIWRDQEVVETLLSFGLLIHAILLPSLRTAKN